MEPLAVVLVNALATDLTFDGGNELVTEVIFVTCDTVFSAVSYVAS